MGLVWLPVKLVLGGVTLAGIAALGYGLGAAAGFCSACSCARQCRAGRPRARTTTDGTVEPGAGSGGSNSAGRTADA